MLYIRMFLIMGIGLYIGRIILDTLGVTDYGIYNVVGGIITVTSFFHSAISAATQRFISFELGRGNTDNLRNIFCTSVNIHIILSIIIVIIGETLGLWFVNTHLNIPNERMIAANWVYQASIVVLICKVLSVPYNASIIAHERMSAFAYISVVEVLLDLVAVYSLYAVRYDKLTVYAFLMVFIAFLIRLCYVIFCRWHFEECRYRFYYNRQLATEMFSYAGWSILGSLGITGKDQAVNVILNLFCGPTANAARGIGIMVSSKVNAFSQNFTMAMSPQITKQYAAGHTEESRNLVYMGSRLSFFLLSIISMPFLLNCDYILNLWLTKIPEYSGRFLQLSLLSSLIYSMSVCVTKAIQATGKVKWFQIGVFLIMMGELPAVWLLLRLGFQPYTVIYPAIASNFIALAFRFWLIRHYVPIYSYKDYWFGVVIRGLFVFLISYVICYFACQQVQNSFWSFIASSIIAIMTTIAIIYALGISRTEKKIIHQYISNKLFTHGSH